MLEYDRIDISEGIDVNKSNDKSKECDICRYWYFLKVIEGSDYRIQFWYMNKDDSISIMQNSNLDDKTGTL